MPKETMSARGVSGLIILLVLCGTVLSGANTVEQDFWLSIGLAGVLFLPVILLYGRLGTLFPGRGLFEIIETLFGRTAGMGLILWVSGYALVVTSLLLRNFVEFTVVIALQDTPRIPLMIAILAVAVYLADKGLVVFGRWSVIICAMILVNVLFTILLSLDVIDLSHIQPVLDHRFSELAANALIMGFIAIGESMLILTLLGHVPAGASVYRIYSWGIFLGIGFFILMVLRNLAILGPEMVKAAKFSAYMAVRIVHFGNFFERVESLISFNLILMGITKITLCLTAAAMGTARLLQTDDYRRLLLPVSLLALALCAIIFKNAYEIFEFVWAYWLLALPVQVVLPLLLWVVAERRAKGGRLYRGGRRY
ncbi:MAG: endospore germination permease [Sporomusaceae bacterium]|nr:endospore germination permease [Sporomusaceae bacterium]